MTGGRSPRIFISAGEVSGDIVAARLIEALRAADASTIVDGVGGDRMARAGATVIRSATHIGAVGISEGLETMPAAAGVFIAAIRHCRVHRPDVAVLIGNDVFNVVLGRYLRRKGIATIAFFPPQTWIWESIARVIAPSFDLVLASFADEARCYGETGVRTEFVGHYLADILTPVTPEARIAARRALGLTAADPVVAILPGSRPREIRLLRPILLGAADLIRRKEPAVQVVAALTSADTAAASQFLETEGGDRVPVWRDSHLVMRAADVVACCSGTATLEAALMGIPMVVVYKASWITHSVVRASIRARLMRGDTAGLPNLLLGRRAIPELIQRHATAPEVAKAVLPLIPDEAPRRAACAALREVRALVERPGTLAEAARIVLARAES